MLSSTEKNVLSLSIYFADFFTEASDKPCAPSKRLESDGTPVESVLQASRACSKDSTCKMFIRIKIGSKVEFHKCLPSSGVNIGDKEYTIFVKGRI